MALLKQLPRYCSVEEKEYVLFLNKRSRDLSLLITEVGPYKSFSIAITLEALEWLKTTCKALMNTPRTTGFFQEKRYVDYCLWVQKTYNKKRYIAEVFKVDDRGRRGCILVLEGLDKAGWAHFTEMLTLKRDTEKKNAPWTNVPPHEPITDQYSSQSDSDSLKDLMLKWYQIPHHLI